MGKVRVQKIRLGEQALNNSCPGRHGFSLSVCLSVFLSFTEEESCVCHSWSVLLRINKMKGQDLALVVLAMLLFGTQKGGGKRRMSRNKNTRPL